MTFAKGTEWVNRSAGYCERCINHRDRLDGRGKGCPVDDMHMEADPEVVKRVIPESMMGDEFLFPKCAMFLDRESM